MKREVTRMVVALKARKTEGMAFGRGIENERQKLPMVAVQPGILRIRNG
jgi:hypothetical protein